MDDPITHRDVSFGRRHTGPYLSGRHTLFSGQLWQRSTAIVLYSVVLDSLNVTRLVVCTAPLESEKVSDSTNANSIVVQTLLVCFSHACRNADQHRRELELNPIAAVEEDTVQYLPG
jgi:hypothetical protein